MGARHRISRRSRRLAAIAGGGTGVLLLAGLVVGAANAADPSTKTVEAKAASSAKPPYNFGSGYSAINGTYTSVTANWIQPKAICDGGQQQTGLWVGLSGAGTIAQTGTAANCDGTTPVYYSWWEMYPAAGVPMTVPTQPGDHMHASVVYEGSNVFKLTVLDVTRGWSRTETKTQNATGGTPSSANVIAEANSDTGDASGNVTDFDSGTFGGATVNGKPLGSRPLWTSNLADMSGVQEDVVSPLAGGGRKFTATRLSNG
jgi:hypothetical protein